MSKHANAGMIGTARMLKTDNGYRAEILNQSQRGLWLQGEVVMNRNFHPFKKGEEFNATIRISDAGRKMVQKVESLTGGTVAPQKTRSKKAAAPAQSSGWDALESGLKAAGVRFEEPTATVKGTLVDALVSTESQAAAAPGIQGLVDKMAQSSAVVVGSTLEETREAAKVVAKQEPSKTKASAKTNEGYYIAPDMRLAFNKMFRMSLNKPERAVKAMMVGPSGYGKSTIPMLFAQSVGYTYMRMDCAKVRDPEEWFGYREAIEGSTIFIKSNFARALEKGNLVVTMDEFNRLEPWIHNSLFPLLDDAGRTTVHDEEFVIGPNVIVVGTINVGYRYTGTFELDEALLNRFDFFLEVGPMGHREETEVLVKRTGVKDAEAAEIVRIANLLRNQEVICSTRTTLQVAEKVASGMNLRQAYEYTVVRRIPQDNTGSSLRKSVVDSINTQLGAFEIDVIQGDVFEMGAAGVTKVEDAPTTVVETKHLLKLHATSSAVATLHLIGAIRKLPLVNAVTVKQAQDLAETVRSGGEIELTLSEKPQDFEGLVRILNSMGVGGKYRSFAV